MIIYILVVLHSKSCFNLVLCISKRLSNKNAESELNFVNNWLTSHIEDAQNILRKPLLLAEFGKSDKDSGFSTYQRDQLFTTVYNKIYASAKRGGAAGGALFWQLITEGVEAYGDSYAIVLSRNPSTANVIAQQSRKLYLIRKIFARMRNVRLWKKAREIRNRINAKRV